MNLAALSLDQAPPLSVPMRFFLTAPLFGVAAGASLLLSAGDQTLGSRWTPAVLSMVHLVLVGFVVPIMFGAMQQMLPVVAGAPLRWPRVVSAVVHTLWTAGAVLLALGLATLSPRSMAAAGLLLLSGALAFFAAAAASLTRAPARTETVTAMRLSLLSFAIATALGVTLAAGHAGYAPLWRIPLTNLHLLWALLGWVGLLIIGVSYQVVPMFQMTPPYPARARRWLAPLLFVLLLARSAAGLADGAPLVLARAVLEVGICATLLLFAAATLRLQSQRRRKIADPTLTAFRVAMIGLGAAVVAHLAGLLGLLGGDTPALLSGLCWGFGFVVPVVAGMLYKIVPFLVWFHLQAINTQRMRDGLALLKLPNMKDAIPSRFVRAQQLVGAVALPLAIVAPFAPRVVTALAGVALMAFFGVLELALLAGYASYRRNARAT